MNDEIQILDEINTRLGLIIFLLSLICIMMFFPITIIREFFLSIIFGFADFIK